MVDLKYVSSNGIEFDLHDFDSAKLFKADFHNVAWKPEVVKKQYGTTVTRFTKDPQKYPCTFRFKGDPAKRKTQIDTFIFQCENDVAKQQPGRIVWNRQYIQGYFNQHDCYPIESGMTWTELEAEFYAPFPFWVEEQFYSIKKGEYPSWVPKDVKGYPSDRNIRYAYTYSYPYGQGAMEYYIDSPFGADFRTIIYGPAPSGVQFIVNDNLYRVNYPLRTGQKLIVDTRDTTPIDLKCIVVNPDDTIINAFDYRDPESVLFERMPGGSGSFYGYGEYDVDMTMYIERSAPI